MVRLRFLEVLSSMLERVSGRTTVVPQTSWQGPLEALSGSEPDPSGLPFNATVLASGR